MSFGFERDALRASGVSKEKQVAGYSHKLGKLYQHFIRDMKPSAEPINRAEALFEWLWITKPSRYQQGAAFRLHEVIDAQLSEENCVVGNCLGLTLLFTSLALRLNVEVGTVYLEHAFEIGPHVLTVLKAGDRLIDIEHSLAEGFDYTGHLHSTGRELWGEKELVADIYHSRANECYEMCEYKKALELYEKAIALNPQYEKALLNKAIVLDKIEREERGSS